MPEAPLTAANAKAQVEALFDSLALEYVRTRERQFSFIAQKRLVIDMLAAARGRILEVGCGPAVMAPELAAMGLEVHGVDVSGEMIRRARQRMAGHPLGTRCHFSLGDFERLEFPDGFFDAVLAMGVLEYLPAYAAALRSTARVLRPGGVAVFTVPNRASSYHVARAAHEALRRGVRRLRGRALPRPFEHNPCVPWALDRELEQAGLRKVDSAACNFIFFPLKELRPELSDSVNRALHPMARWFLARFLGAQYVVKARRRS
ncbi:MAG TPA: class I SAM-dependent methyltransferase [Burkholderiales bacterium]|jgi:ubiquinone/menaquinone biosynthesis C-methylase UbiE|nr:class I SAM-dependent methyltransferase [Burkholderiales bacterium]